MLCSAAKDWLLLSDDAGRPTPEVGSHLAECASCRELAAQITRLEATVRAVPTPAKAFKSREAFLSRVVIVPRRSRLRQYVATASTLAASLVIGITLAAVLRMPQPEEPGTAVAEATPTVVEDLVEWNLRLTETEAPTEREVLVRELPRFQAVMQKASLSSEDRDLAEKLIAHGKRMSETADPVDEAEGFHDLADNVLVRLDSSAQDVEHSVRLARMYAQLVDRGFEPNLVRAEKQAKAEKQARVQFLTKAKHRQADRASALAEKIPEKAREHVRANRPKAKGNRPAK